MHENLNTLIVKIEEFMNRNNCYSIESPEFCTEKSRRLNTVISKFDASQKRKIDEYLNDIKSPETQPDYVCKRMPEKGFVYNDGQLNFVKFYTYARINPDVWHTFITQKHKASEDTMFKIIFALQLSEKEADDFLSLGGAAFNKSNVTHKYVLACINTKIYDPDEIYEVLDFYKVHNIYAEKSRKDYKCNCQKQKTI